MILKGKILSAAAAGLLAVSLLAGCGGGGGNKDGGSGAPKAEAPKTPKAEPSMTFKFGTREAKVYEVTGIDLKDKIRTWRLAAVGDAVYFQIGQKPPHMAKATLKDATLSELVDLGEKNESNDLAVNDKVAVWETADRKTAVYDGKETKIGGRWPGSLIAKTGRISLSNRDEFYLLNNDKLQKGKLSNGTFRDIKEIANLKDLPDFKNVHFTPVASEQDEIYLRAVVNKPGENRKIPILVALDKDGKLLRRYEGVAGGKRDFCVTDKYVVYGDANGYVRVFEKKSAKELGTLQLNLRPFALWTLERDKVLVYDDGDKKLYRIDF